MKGRYFNGSAKCLIFVITVYLITVCLIYNCMIDITFWSDSAVSTNSRHATAVVKKDVYRLNWNPKEKVFYKKVRSPKRIQRLNRISKRINTAFDDSSNYTSYIKVTSDFYIFSAFYDKRLSTLYVRMIASLRRYTERKNTFWCHFKTSYVTKNEISFFSSKLIYYEMNENHKKTIGGWILSCDVPKEVTSSLSELWVSTSTVYQNTSDTINVKITVPEGFEKDNEINRNFSKPLFGICVPPLYGTVEPKSFVEFIEFAKLIGVNKIVFYVFEVQDEISKILEHYKSIGFVDTIQWKLPFRHKYIWNYGQSLAANDCLYRHMTAADYLAFLDIDEMLVPRNDDKTLGELIHSLDLSTLSGVESFSGFTFRSTFFDPEFSKSAEFNEAKAAVRINRTARFSHFRNKVLVRPDRVFEVGIHHISRSWPDYKNYSVAKVNPSLAAIYHYRACIKEFGIDCSVIKEDITVSVKYGRQLKDNVISSMMKIV